MLDQFLDTQLAAIDNLDELKVTLVALLLIERRGGGMASVTEADLISHSAVRDGLRLPSISLRPALQMALARGTLVQAATGNVVRYFRNDEAGRRAAAAYESSDAPRRSDVDADRMLHEAGALIARLESLDFYAPAADEPSHLAEWLACGYTREEIFAAIRETLRNPRARGRPHRELSECAAALFRQPPALPSDYYQFCVARSRTLPDEVANLKLRLNRMPTHHEFRAVRDAVALFGLRAVTEGLRSMARSGPIDVATLIPLLSESEEAALATSHTPTEEERQLRHAIRLYESILGLPVTALIADDIRTTLETVHDQALWKAALEYAARANKKSWPYVKKMLQNPSPTLFTPTPANATAKLAFDTYRQRVNRQLDPVVAGEINALAQQLNDPAIWTAAFDRAAAANVMRWDYIRSVLTSRPDAPASGRTFTQAAAASAKRPPAERRQPRRSSTFRREQAEFSQEQRAAAEEKARRELDEEADHE